MKALVLFVALLFFGGSVWSQEKTVKITGKVVDAETKFPLYNVNIRINNTLEGTTTDQYGTFKISTAETAPVFIFSMVGYESKSIKVNVSIKKDLVINLYRKTDTLQSVVIQNIPQKRQRQISNSVVDYTVYNENILVLSYINRSPVLTLLNKNLDTLHKISISAKPVGLFKDCLGNSHLMYDKKVYQVFYQNKMLQFLDPTPSEQFKNTLYPCVDTDEENIYISTKRGGQKTQMEYFDIKTSNQEIAYTAINKQTKLRNHFLKITDTDIIEKNKDDIAWMDKKAGVIKHDPRHKPDSVMTGPIRDGAATGVGLYRDGLEKENERIFYEVILAKEIYAPLFVIQNSVYVFNYAHSKIMCYYRSILTHEIPISYHKDKHWKREMLIDRKYNVAYAVFEKNGITTLKSIHLNSGDFIQIYQIPHAFVSQISIHDNHIYYLRNTGDVYGNVVLERLNLN